MREGSSAERLTKKPFKDAKRGKKIDQANEKNPINNNVIYNFPTSFHLMARLTINKQCEIIPQKKSYPFKPQR